MNELIAMGSAAKKSAGILAGTLSAQKNGVLWAMADGLERCVEEIAAANAIDTAKAEAKGMSRAMIDRLTLTGERIRAMAEAVRYVAGLEDPVGKVLDGKTCGNGLQISRVAVPLGVVGMIYESRPNVTVDSAALCLKSGNACILRGGKEAIESNKALVKVMHGALDRGGIPRQCIQLIEDTSRETAAAMMRLNGYIDVLIPRGGKGLIASVVQNATVPVIETGAGICHVYVDSAAELEMACDIVHNAKTSRPSVCNAMETLLVHRDCAGAFLPMLAQRLGSHAVQIRACPEALDILGGAAVAAAPDDFDTEFGDYIMAVRVVKGLEEAMEHIAAHSTHHSDAIVTADYGRAQRFVAGVDSAAVYVNASTRFTDGAEFGLGAEIGISTQKLHARGPMGLQHLTSSKYIVRGSGQIRQ